MTSSMTMATLFRLQSVVRKTEFHDKSDCGKKKAFKSHSKTMETYSDLKDTRFDQIRRQYNFVYVNRKRFSFTTTEYFNIQVFYDILLSNVSYQLDY